MSDLILCVRRLTMSNLSWFYETRRLPREVVGQSKERALTINHKVMTRWFRDKIQDQSRFEVRCRYFDGQGPDLPTEILFEAIRPIQLTHKNWRLGGDRIRGEFYGTLRQDDLILLSYNTRTATVSWLVIRGHNMASPRFVLENERIAYDRIVGLLGEANADGNMWLLKPNEAESIIKLAHTVYPNARELLHGVVSPRELCRSLWNLFTGEGFTPQGALDQISTLIAMRRPSELAPIDPRVRSEFGLHKAFWSELVTADDSFAAMEEFLASRSARLRATLGASELSEQARRILPLAMSLVGLLPLESQTPNDAGAVYEELLSYRDAGKNGQFTTPRALVKVMVELAELKLGETIVDPAAGTAGLLIEAHQVQTGMGRTPGGNAGGSGEFMDWPRKLHGFDSDAEAARLGRINALLHGIGEPIVTYQDSLQDPPPVPATVVLADLAWNGRVERSRVSPRLGLKTDASELLFVELCLDQVVLGGRFVLAVPGNLLSGSSSAHLELRRRLIEKNQLQAVIALPEGAYHPYSTMDTAILVGRKGGSTYRVWLYVVGDAANSEGSPLLPWQRDLDHVPQAFRKTVLGSREEWNGGTAEAARQRSWTVVHETLVKSDYVLTPQKYAPSSGRQAAGVTPDRLLENALELEREIMERIRVLRSLLRGSDR